MTRAEKVAAYLKDIAAGHAEPIAPVDAGALTAMLDARARQEGVAGGVETAGRTVGADTVNAGLEAVAAGGIPSHDQVFGIEAIVIPDKRPAMPLAKGTYTATHALWLHLNDAQTKQRLTARARSIGRVEVPGSRYPYGGTAFVAGKDLLMTNRHVAEIFASGLGQRHLAFLPGIAPGFSAAFAPDNADQPALAVRNVVMIHPYWDMALLAVEGLAPDQEPLPFEPREAAAFDKSEVAVIGYPAYDYRNDADAQRTVFDNRFGIKQLQPGLLRERGRTESFRKTVDAITHDCSTLGGNSGSAVIHIGTGRVLGLHFGGEYLARNYAVPACDLALDGRVVDAGVAFDPAVRPEKPPSWTGFWTAADAAEAPPAPAPAVAPAPASAPAAAEPVPPPAAASAPAAAEIVLPLHITIRIGEARAGEVTVSAVAAGPAGPAPVERLAEPAHDGEYGSRAGFDETFLGLRTPLPRPVRPEVVALARDGSGRLDYQNFSVVMHAKRQLALFTASNVSREAALRRPEPGRDYTRKGLSGLGPADQERWFADPRMDEALQLPDVFFTKDDGAFDKGHIVRREDVAWGRDFDALRRANGDTFHVTNCSPQVAGFNRSASGADNWGDLENVVLTQAASERLSLFAGPVLADDDPRFLGNFGPRQRRLVQIPTRFWKVVVARTAEGLAAFGFVLEQDLSAVDLKEFAVPDAFRRFLQPIADIEAMTGLAFAEEVSGADQYEGRGREIARQAAIGCRRRG